MPAKIAPQGTRRPTFIKQWRAYRGLTQQVMADRLGTTKQSVSRIEAGQQTYTQESLEGIADILRCTPADLLSRDPNDEPGIPLADLPDGDRRQVEEFMRALRVIRTRDDGTPAPELPDTVKKPAVKRRKAG